MLLKVCGLTRQKDMLLAAELGADFCGFIFHPRSPRAVTPEEAALLRSGGMKRVGVFVGQNAVEIRRIMVAARLDYAQLHGGQSLACADAVGSERVIRVLWPETFATPEDMQQEVDRQAAHCAFYLADAGRQGGGSGLLCGRAWLRQVQFPHPWLLAGGLHAGNAAQALADCAPDGLDCNSALEDRPGCKNAAKLRALAVLKGPAAAVSPAPEPL